MVHVIEALIYYCIDLKKLWLDQFDEVVVLAIELFHPPHLGLIKEGFGRMRKVSAEQASQIFGL
jgi:hypothetical protein